MTGMDVKSHRASDHLLRERVQSDDQHGEARCTTVVSRIHLDAGSPLGDEFVEFDAEPVENLVIPELP